MGWKWEDGVALKWRNSVSESGRQTINKWNLWHKSSWNLERINGGGNQPIDSSLPPKRVVQAWPGLSFLSLLYSLMLQRYLHFFFSVRVWKFIAFAWFYSSLPFLIHGVLVSNLYGRHKFQWTANLAGISGRDWETKGWCVSLFPFQVELDWRRIWWLEIWEARENLK